MGLIFFGPPGCGKGTQSNILMKEFNFIPISVGDLMRKEIKDKTEIGKKIEDMVGRGKLIPDDIINEVMHYNLLNLKDKNFILDGYPRTINQAEFLLKDIKENNIKINNIVNFVINLDELKKRIEGRLVCEQCAKVFHKDFNPPLEGNICDNCGSKNLKSRKDDNINTLQIRINEYNIKTLPVLKFLSDYFQIIDIDASLSVDDITNKLKNRIFRG